MSDRIDEIIERNRARQAKLRRGYKDQTPDHAQPLLDWTYALAIIAIMLAAPVGLVVALVFG